MKSFALVAIALCLAIAVHADDMKVGSAYNGVNNGGFGNFGPSIDQSGIADTNSRSISAPCPRNYLFSCQPHLQPAPCNPGARSGFGDAGAFSQNYPVYAMQVPQYVNGYQFN